MIHVGTIELKDTWKYDEIIRLNTLPDVIIKKLAAFRQEKDRLRHLCGRILLKKMLMELGHGHDILEYIRLNEYNKPYIDGNFNFNISHSGNLVACVVSSEIEVGIDVEQKKNIDPGDFSMVFTDAELIWIAENKDLMTERFYDLWTMKEAIVKANGKGMGIDLQEIEIKGEIALCKGETWNLVKLEINSEYAAHIAFSDQNKINGKEPEISKIIQYSPIP